MNEKLLRVGTTYIPVTNVELSSEWYVKKLGAEVTYQDEDKAILNMADQSVFLVKSKEGQNSNFIDDKGIERFSLTFEVDGLSALETLHKDFKDRGISVGAIEERGHSSRNFVFRDPNGNLFDVWSQLSPVYRKKYLTSH